MSLQSHTGRQFVDSLCWACRVCRRQRVVTVDSFFAGSQLKLPQLLDCIYWWSHELKLAGACVESGMGHTSMVQWRNFIRDICCQYLLDHPVVMGGPGGALWRLMRANLCIGSITAATIMRAIGSLVWWSVRLMVAVPDRTATTLLPIIAQHVLPGTRIIMDGWWAYNQLVQHDVVNHQLPFVDPNDPTLHTNTIEGAWANIEAKFRAMHGTSDALFNTYLQEYLWRKIHRDNVFANILYWIRHYYPV